MQRQYLRLSPKHWQQSRPHRKPITSPLSVGAKQAKMANYIITSKKTGIPRTITQQVYDQMLEADHLHRYNVEVLGAKTASKPKEAKSEPQTEETPEPIEQTEPE